MALQSLNKKLNNLSRTDYRQKSKSHKSRTIKIILIAVILIVASYLTARSIYNSSRQLVANGRVLQAALKQENLDEINKSLISTTSSAKGLDRSLSLLFWVRAVPILGGYYSDAKHFSSALVSELEAASAMAKALEPYKVEIGLTGQSTAGQDKIAQGVKVLNKLLPEIDKYEPFLKKARKEVEKVDTNKYPEKVGSFALRSKLEAAKSMIIGLDVMMTDNKELVAAAPDALGTNSPKTYLVLFQNDKELRPTGGFITAYTFIKMDKGHMTTTGSDDIYRLDERLLKVCQNKICPLTPPTPITKYLPEVTGKTRSAWSMRDSNISPDIPTSAQQFEKMYQLLGEGLPFDGIVYIDSQVVEELVAVTGPVDVFGTTYSAETDKRCNCPNVIYELEKYAEITAKGEEDRKAVLGTLMQQILSRILGSGITNMPSYLTVTSKLADDKHIMFYMHDLKLQTALSKLNWVGEIKQPAGDYIHINDANFAGGKSNLYVEEKVTVDINVDNQGVAKHKVTIEYKNPQAFNTWLNGILRDYVRLYVPKGSTLTASKGSQEKVATQQDDGLSKTYFEGFIQVRPQNSLTLSFEYILPDKIIGNKLPLLIQKQPGAKDHHYVVKVNGNKKAEFDLTSDKQLDLTF